MPASLNAAKVPTRPLLIAAGGAAGLLVATSLALWAYYGTQVFYEILLSGLAACF